MSSEITDTDDDPGDRGQHLNKLVSAVEIIDWSHYIVYWLLTEKYNEILILYTKIYKCSYVPFQINPKFFVECISIISPVCPREMMQKNSTKCRCPNIEWWHCVHNHEPTGSRQYLSSSLTVFQCNPTIPTSTPQHLNYTTNSVIVIAFKGLN